MSSYDDFYFIDPLRFFHEHIVKKAADRSADDQDANPKILERCVVLYVDNQGGKLQNSNGTGTFTVEVGNKKKTFSAISGPNNPPNSIAARFITEVDNMMASDDNFIVFWPMFTDHMSQPIKPGEHVYVIFEDPHRNHGMWLTRVSGHSGVNVAQGSKQYKTNKPSDRSIDAFGDNDANNSGEPESIEKYDINTSTDDNDSRKAFGDT